MILARVRLKQFDELIGPEEMGYRRRTPVGEELRAALGELEQK